MEVYISAEWGWGGKYLFMLIREEAGVLNEDEIFFKG